MFHMRFPCDKIFQYVPLFLTLLSCPCILKWKLELWYFTWEFLVIWPFRGYFIFYPVTLTLEFDPFLGKNNLANNFWTGSAAALMFYMSISCDKTFPLVPIFFTLDLGVWPIFLKTLTLLITFEQWEFDISLKMFNLTCHFRTVSARAWIFYMSILWDKTSPWVPKLLTLWPWTWSLTYFLKNFHFINNIWIVSVELRYFTVVFIVTDPFYGNQQFLPFDLDRKV